MRGNAVREVTPVRIARRLLRARACWTAVAPLAIATAVLMCIFSGLHALTLDSQLVVQRDMGRFEKQAGFGVAKIPTGTSIDDALEDPIRQEDSSAFVYLAILGLLLDSGEDVVAMEGKWANRPYPDRYILTSGRWPERPGEIVVAARRGSPQDVGAHLPALGGELDLIVVGNAVDRFPSPRRTLLIASGTWAGLAADIESRYRALSAQPVVLWNKASAADMASVAGAALSEVTPQAGDRERLVTRFRDSLVTRSERAAALPPEWIRTVPGAFTIPALLLPALLVGLGWALRSDRSRVWTRLLVWNGIGPRVARAAVWLSFCVAVCVALAAGVGLGFACSLALRLLLEVVQAQPLSAPVSLAEPVTMVATGAFLALAMLALVPTERTGPDRAEVTLRPWARDTRQVVGAFVLAAFGVSLSSVRGPLGAMWASALVALGVTTLAPEMVGVARRLVASEAGGVRRRLAGRLIAERPGKFALSAGLVTAMMGSSLGFLILVSSLAATVSADIRPDVLPGQLLLVDRGVHILPPAEQTLVQAASSPELAGARRIELSPLTTFAPRSQAPTFSVGLEGVEGHLLGMDTVEDVEAVLGRALSPDAVTVLASGGILEFADDPDAEASPGVLVTKNSKVVSRVPLEVAAVPTPAVDWVQGKAGVMLTRAAEARGFPMRTGPVMYTGLEGAQARIVRDTLADAGVDPGTVEIFVPPEPPIPPTALSMAAIALSMLTVLVLVAEARSRVVAVRSYLGRLHAVGVAPNWLRDVLFLQQSVLMLAGFIGASAIAFVPLWFTVDGMGTGYTFDVPWSQLALMVAAVVSGCMGSLAMAARGLKPTAK